MVLAALDGGKMNLEVQMSKMSVSWMIQEGAKYCPFLPPIPVPSELNPNKMELYPAACLKKSCAVFDSCQGAGSSVSRRAEILPIFASIVRGLAGLPLLGPVLKTQLASQADKLEAMTRPVPPEAATA